MDIYKLREWLSRMERLGEADIPIIEIDGYYLTPREIVEHAMANDHIWHRIQELYPNLDPVTMPKELLIERLRRKYEEGKLLPIYTFGYPHVLTPEQQIEEAERGTPIGMEILEAEKKLIEELLRG